MGISNEKNDLYPRPVYIPYPHIINNSKRTINQFNLRRNMDNIRTKQENQIVNGSYDSSEDDSTISLVSQDKIGQPDAQHTVIVNPELFERLSDTNEKKNELMLKVAKSLSTYNLERPVLVGGKLYQNRYEYMEHLTTAETPTQLPIDVVM